MRGDFEDMKMALEKASCRGGVMIVWACSEAGIELMGRIVVTEYIDCGQESRDSREREREKGI